MCGICGKISVNGNMSEELIRKMCGALTHRGPDDEGVYLNNKINGQTPHAEIGLGHRRLSIIDLSPAGHQPMANEDKTVWIVLNGEIYNYSELKGALKAKGHIFRSNTDTEVILHLYEEKGADCVKDLRGMFAFAVWDEKEEKLLLARDRLGKKPVFYSFKGGGLTFASELNALLQDAGISREVDIGSVDDFLGYGYIPAPFTIFNDVKKLPPAHVLIWQKGEIKIERYWRLDYSEKLNLKEEEYCERVLDLLKESVRIRLVSDVPLGAFLSGGIDSSVIVAMMAQVMDRPVKTFSIGFEDKSFDETGFARIIFKKFNTEHREFIVKPNALEVLPELIRHFGEPYGDTSAVPTYYLSKMTRRYVTVALNGDGGDESFAGYERYAAMKMAEQHKFLSSLSGRLLGKIIKNIPESTNKKDNINRLKRFVNSAGMPAKDRYARIMSIFSEEHKACLYSDFLKKESSHKGRPDAIRQEYENLAIKDIVDSVMSVDLATYMPGDLLPKVDIASMSNSLECRSPFLDHKFLEFSAKIPSNLKIKGLATKYILKKSLKNILPDSILKREKMGFGVPVAGWFKNELKGYAYDILLSGRAAGRGYFDKDKIKSILDSHASGKANNGAKIWCLLNLELWHRIFTDNNM